MLTKRPNAPPRLEFWVSRLWLEGSSIVSHNPYTLYSIMLVNKRRFWQVLRLECGG